MSNPGFVLEYFNAGRFAPKPLAPGCEVIDLNTYTREDRLKILETLPMGSHMVLYGYRTSITKHFYRPSTISRMRLMSDTLADDALISVQKKRSNLNCPYAMSIGADTLLEELMREGDPAATALLQAMHTVPNWVDWKRIERGQRFFSENLLICAIMLSNLSLLGGYGAEMINEVLLTTSYLTSNRDKTFRRLMETTQFISDCTDDGAMIPGSPAWRTMLRVRMLHASVRYRTFHRPNGWDVKKLGVPVNICDMIATNLGFSVVVLMGMERAQFAKHVTTEDMNDYLHLWKLIGYYSGIPDCEEFLSAFDSIEAAQCLLESILSYIMNPAESSLKLVWSGVQALSYRLPFLWSPKQTVAVTCFLAGVQYARAMGMPAMFDPRLDDAVVDTTPNCAYWLETCYTKSENCQLSVGYPGTNFSTFWRNKADLYDQWELFVMHLAGLAIRFAFRLFDFVTSSLRVFIGYSTREKAYRVNFGEPKEIKGDTLIYKGLTHAEALEIHNVATDVLRPLFVMSLMLRMPFMRPILGRIQKNGMKMLLVRRLRERTIFPLRHPTVQEVTAKPVSSITAHIVHLNGQHSTLFHS